MVSRGPILFRVRSLEENLIASGGLGQAVYGTERIFRPPRELRIVGIFAMVMSGLAVDLAGLELSIYTGDEPLVFSGRRLIAGAGAGTADPGEPAYVSARALVGSKHRWFPLDIEAGPQHRPLRMKLRNVGPNAISPVVYLRVSDAS